MKGKEPILNVENLKINFHTERGIIPAVDDVSFQIRDGEIMAIVGESGSGKSVTSLSIMGLLDEAGKVANGSVTFQGDNILKYTKKKMQNIRGNDISMIFQEPLTSLNPVFTVGNQLREAILTHQNVSKKEAKETAIRMLKKVGIPRADKVYKSYPHALSGGMRQRVMIAMGLSSNPKLLIADEPTTALDVTIQAQILELMRELIEETDASIMLITHNLGVVGEMADYVIVMYAGQVVEEADVFKLYKEPKHPYTQGLLDSTIKVNHEKDHLETIPGTVPMPNEMPKGCRFHPRCKFAKDICISSLPELETLQSNNKVRCWMYTEEGRGMFDE